VRSFVADGDLVNRNVLHLACDIVACCVLMSCSHTKEEIQLSQDRRDGITNFLLEWLTGPDIDSRTLGHFRFIGEMFSITPKIKEMCRASSLQGRQELALSVAVSALPVAVSDEPVQPTDRQIERKERREADKEFKQRVASLKPAGAGVVAAESVKSPSIFNKPRAELSPDQLGRVGKSRRERQARYRAKLKAEKSQIGRLTQFVANWQRLNSDRFALSGARI
jgi:hypothetical protein